MSIACAAFESAIPVLPTAVAKPSIRIIVANADGARIFRPAKNGGLQQVTAVTNPLRTGAKSRNAAERMSTPSNEPAVLRANREAEAFAQILSLRLADICSLSAETRIYLLAELSFLERLRAHMDAFTHGCIAREIGGDYTDHNVDFIRALLPRHL